MEHNAVTEGGGLRDGGTGLRERSKARRRAAIIRAAFTLFAERGYQATTIADIAAAAEVAPRTVAMYFPSKQDIAMARFSATVDSLTCAMRGLAPGQSITEAVGRWLRTYEAAADRELTELALRMFAANPELNALRSAWMAATIAEGAALVARETGAAPGDPGPQMASVATAAILLELLDFPPGPRREEAITAAMRFLDAGIAALGTAASATDRSDPVGLSAFWRWDQVKPPEVGGPGLPVHPGVQPDEVDRGGRDVTFQDVLQQASGVLSLLACPKCHRPHGRAHRGAGGAA
jgi:AcrR family transcriptional regulator